MELMLVLGGVELSLMLVQRRETLEFVRSSRERIHQLEEWITLFLR